MKKKLLIFLLAFICISILNSTIINIPADQPTIQQGIDIAINGDIVLIQPGTYFENINYNGKNITVASLFLTTLDTTYIYNTIIDGGQPLNPEYASVVTFENSEDENAILTGLTIKNGSGTYADPSSTGYYHYLGGGIFCLDSDPNLENLQISENTVETMGAGIYCYNSNPNLENITISNNSANWHGGGICCIENSNLTILNTKIINNISGSSGGGIFFHSESNSQLEDVVISGNTAEGSGGAICSYSSNINLENTTISNNISGSRGGGIYTYVAEIYLSGVNISNNSAESKGGGIAGSIMVFDSENRSNIYSNSAQFGNDLYNSSGNTVNVIVDTFTVMNPTNYHAFPINQFTFDILHGLEPQVNADLYVSPDGDNANSGLSFDDPLQTINYALSIISANSENPRTIHLDSGTYSPETNGESFPILCTSWVSILGSDENSTTLDADMQESVIYCSGVEGVSIEGVTLTNGVGYWEGGGIYCTNSELDLSDITISDCTAGTAGGIYHTNSNSVFNNITVINNAAKHYGGIYSNGSTLSIIDSDILSNHADETAGGIYCGSNEIDIISTNIVGNYAGNGGGIVCSNSDPELFDVLISENVAYMGGGIQCWDSSPILENVTISYNIAEYQGGGICCYEDSSPVFCEDNRCNIYLNTSPMGNDLYSQEMMNVIVDTFTVMVPTGFHASPITNFTFDIQHGMMEQVNADLYVSPLGDNANDGLSWDSPLKTVTFALSKILVDSLNQHTIFLSDGVFSPETNEEIFPIRFIDYITLSGMGIDSTFINVAYNNENSDAFVFEGIQTATLENMTITNSYGIECSNNSSPKLLNLSISDNIGYGIRCFNNSDPFIKKCIISNNSTGIMCSHESDPIVINTTISNNTQQYSDGGIYCYDNSHPILVNSILWDNDPQEIELTNYGDPCSVTISHCDIQGGENGIIVGNGSVNWLSGNINVNPLFIDVPVDYHLQENSPCIDAGTAFFEWQGNTLLNMTPDEYFGIAPDMGAYEWEGASYEDQQVIPLVNKLHGNYPNPFNPETTISFSVTQTSSFVTIDIFNIKGQKIKQLEISNLKLGINEVIWDGKNNDNQPVASGIYFYQLNVDEKVIASKKCLLLK